jgi:hypothetical protein
MQTGDIHHQNDPRDLVDMIRHGLMGSSARSRDSGRCAPEPRSTSLPFFRPHTGMRQTRERWTPGMMRGSTRPGQYPSARGARLTESPLKPRRSSLRIGETAGKFRSSPLHVSGEFPGPSASGVTQNRPMRDV